MAVLSAVQAPIGKCAARRAWLAVPAQLRHTAESSPRGPSGMDRPVTIPMDRLPSNESGADSTPMRDLEVGLDWRTPAAAVRCSSPNAPAAAGGAARGGQGPGRQAAHGTHDLLGAAGRAARGGL
jgi:hypothetical protein